MITVVIICSLPTIILLTITTIISGLTSVVVISFIIVGMVHCNVVITVVGIG